jgi:hypothetical protein
MGLRQLLELRGSVAALVRAGHDATASGEVVIPEAALEVAAAGTPRWLTARPASYAIFAQPVVDADRGALVVNRVFGGWGRFTSRFLRALDPVAAAQVRAQIRGALTPGARAAQIRPVRGFNANLHPLLVDDEIGGYDVTALDPDGLSLVHDVDTDQLRVRITATGECLDVLYLGFGLEASLSVELVPLASDLAAGLLDYQPALVPRRQIESRYGSVGYRPRLRYGAVILARARWEIPAGMAGRWRVELDRETGPPARTVARWRAAFGLPEHVYMGAAVEGEGGGLDSLRSYFDRPRSQYVDLGSALHLRCLSRTLARYQNGLVVEEALPAPVPGSRAVELVTELYREGT